MTDINHKYKTIFIHIYKTGGTSISSMLDTPETERIFGSHATASEMAAILEQQGRGSIWEDYFKFSFVRNPFDLHASLFFYIKAYPSHDRHKYAVKGFPYFVESLVKEWLYEERSFGSNKYLRQVDFTTCKVPLDFIGKTENFKEDMATVCQRIGIQPLPIVEENRSPGKIPLEHLYNTETIRMVQETFEEDFKTFNYPIKPYWIT